MKVRTAQVMEQLRTSLWLVPGVCTLLAALLAVGLIEFDARFGTDAVPLPWSVEGGADSARAVLSTLAGSMITVAGTIYSITIVVLTLASVQFAPRVLGSFMRDRGNQVVLGFFVATFTYCLLVLRAVRGSGQDEFVPHTAVTGSVVLALISLAMLIYFIDHIFHGIQVANIVDGVARRTVQQINRLYPQPWREGLSALPAEPELPDDRVGVPAHESGYVQFVDYDALLALATREDLVVRQHRFVGAFVIAGTPLVFAAPAARVTPHIEAQINAAFALGSQPTLQQDVAFGVRQIVDIALKAISPAVNDPTTAVNCIDHLGVILRTLATRHIPDRDRRDATGQIRIIVHERSFHDLVRLAFDQIRHYGAHDHVILLRMLDTLAGIAGGIPNPAYRAALGDYVERIAASAEREIADPAETQVLRAHVETARRAVQGGL